MNANVESSPLVVKQAFADGLFLTVMPHKPDQPNGTALISKIPALSVALKQVAALRRQFLPYFVEGTFLRDSILSAPAGFVHAHQLPGRLLIFAVNDSAQPKIISFQSDLALWLPSVAAYQVKMYSESGKLIKQQKRSGSHAAFITGVLAPAEIAVFEVQNE